MTKPVITTRAGKGSALTWTEGDTNLTNLRDATISVTDGTNTAVLNLNDTLNVTAGTGISVAVDNVTKTATITNTQTPGATNLDGLSDVVITAAASGKVLAHNGTNWVDTDPSTITVGTATIATNINIASNDGNANDTVMYPALSANSTTGSQALHVDSGGLFYNASTNALTATSFIGNASTVTITNDNSSATTHYPLFASATTGSLNPKTRTGFNYVPSTNTLTVGAISASLNGTVGAITPSTGAFTTLSASGNTTLSSTLTAGGSVGTSGQVLQSTGTGVQWATPSSGGNNIIILQLGTSDTFNLSTTGSTESFTIASTGGVSGVSVSTNSFTLPAGTYVFQMPTITSSNTTYADWKVQNTTDATEAFRFTSNTVSFSGVTKAFYWSPSSIFTITGSKTFKFMTTSGTAVLINGATINGKLPIFLHKVA